MNDNIRKEIYDLFHDIGKVAPLFREVDKYLRQRGRGCSGRTSYNKAIKILDKIEERMFVLYNKVHGE